MDGFVYILTLSCVSVMVVFSEHRQNCLLIRKRSCH